MIGEMISHYRIVEKIGEGGMGQVYKAWDARLSRHVAIKVLPADKITDNTRRERFLREARAASALNHPNIITIHDILSENGNEFLVMEFVTGFTVSQMLARGPLPLTQALSIATQVADALATAHEANIVHRDLKPANIMITQSGHVKLLDFGLAKLVESNPSTDSTDSSETQTIAEPLTMHNTIMGTPRYMSPEQAEGKKVDARSDIFTFGVVLYEMLTARCAFEAPTTLSTLTLVLRDEPKPIQEINDGVPGDLADLITRCIRKAPEERYQHMRVIYETLRLMTGQTSFAPTIETKPIAAVVPPPAGTSAPTKPGSSDKTLPEIPVAPPPAARPATPKAAPPPPPLPAPTPSAAPPPVPVAETQPAIPIPKPKPTPVPAAATTKQKPAAPATKPKPAAAAPGAARKSNSKVLLAVVAVLLLGIAGIAAVVILRRPAPPEPVVAVTEPPPDPGAVPMEPPVEQPAEPAEPVAAEPPPAAPAAPAATKRGKKAPPKEADKKGTQPVATTPEPAAPAPQQPAPAPAPLTPAAPAPKAPVVARVQATIRDGMPIGLMLTHDIMEDATQGQFMSFTALQDIVVDGVVVIAKGAPARGVVTEAPKKKLLGRSPGMMIYETVQTVDGKQARLRATSAPNSGSPKPREIGQVKNEKKGVQVPAGTQYLAYTDGETVVSARKPK